MATVTGLTAARMIEMENATIIAAEVVGEDLILTTRGGTQINAGNITGPPGPAGGAFVICTSSTRPTFGALDEGQAIYETDTGLIRIWDGAAWKLQEKIICTSSTRPTMTSGDAGVKIYETDTSLEYIWTGSSWFLSVSYVPSFANAAERTSEWPSPGIGSLSLLETTPGSLWVYEATGWAISGQPPGTCTPFMGTVAPLNWVFMYGQTITNAQSLYPVLWAMLDSTWKSGSNLIVPDLRGRVVAGKDDMGGVPASRLAGSNINGTILGANGGSSNTEYHSHPFVDPGHSHPTGETLAGGGGYGMAAGGKSLSLATGNATTGGSVGFFGGGNSGNVQPTIIMNWILKVV